MHFFPWMIYQISIGTQGQIKKINICLVCTLLSEPPGIMFPAIHLPFLPIQSPPLAWKYIVAVTQETFFHIVL